RLGQRRKIEFRLTSGLTGAEYSIMVQLSARQYAEAVRVLLSPGIENLNSLLEANDLDSSALDGLILAGDAGTTYPIPDVFCQSYLGKVYRPHEGVSAFGAVMHACDAAGRSIRLPPQLEKLRTPDLVGIDPVPGADSADNTATGAPVRFASVIQV